MRFFQFFMGLGKVAKTVSLDKFFTGSEPEMAIIINVTKPKAMIRRVYTFNEHAVWHSILNGDVKNDFVSENMLALSTFGIYHWQKGTDYA